MQYAQPSAPSCVGRESELERLHALYREACERGERLALLEGPSGVGKSRIVQEFRARVRLDGGVVLEGHCEPGRAFGPFADIVDSALRFLDEMGRRPLVVMADLACRGGCHSFWYQHDGDGARTPRRNTHSMTSDDLEARERRSRFFDAVQGLLREVATIRPPVVLLHDLERADHGTLQLLRVLLEGTGPWSDGVAPERLLRALFVASVRSDGRAELDDSIHELRDDPSAHRIEVGHLDADGVRQFLQCPTTVARVFERTGGNPEAIELLLDGDPLTPEDRVRRQLAALEGSSRALMEALALIERPADIELLSRIAGAQVDAAATNRFGRSELVNHSIVDGAMLFSFSRESDRERAYAMLSSDRRQQLHTRCVDVYVSRPGHQEDAASHALKARDIGRAVPLALEAARSLAARHAHSEAAALLERVVSAMPGETPPVVREELADLYRVAGDYRRALDHATALRTREPESAQAARRVGELLTLAGRLDDAAVELGNARHLAASTEDPTAVVEVEGLLAELHYQRAAYDEAREWAERALTAAEKLGALSLSLLARNTLGKLALAQMDANAAAELFEENRARAEDAGLGHQEAQALTNLGVAMIRRGDLTAAEDAFSRAIDVAARVQDTRDRAIATENLAVLAHLRRDYARAQGYYHDAVALLKRLGNRAMLARVAINLGELYLSLGERSRARTLCEFATHMGGTGLPPSVQGEGLILRGRIDSTEGNTSAARTSFEAALRIYRRLGEARVTDALLEIARVALADGDVPGARAAVAELPVLESPKREAEVALVAVDIERAAGGQTLQAARRAVEQSERARDDELLLPALVRLARALVDAQDFPTADRVLDRAQGIEEQLAGRVPEESLDAWAGRSVRRELEAVQGLVATGRSRGRRDSSLPPPRTSTVPPPPPAAQRRRDHWSRCYPAIVGNSSHVTAILSLLDKVAPTDALVLIRGESGTGKELIAEALHRNSPRRDKAIVKVNCAALVETLLLSELFGHERGAFTGANSRKKGRFEMADGGTIFLDEIGDISAKTQVALLRVLQEREFERVGGTSPIKVDVRIVAATHRNLEEMVREGLFREDLYYRLRGVMMEMPPLRGHVDDIGPLCDHLLGRIAEERNEKPKILSFEALELLKSHRWPGNVRELENVLRSATLFADSIVLEVIDFAAFADSFRSADPEPETSASPEPELASASSTALEDLIYGRVRDGDRSWLDMKKVLERECIARALHETEGNITKAANLLGMKRPRLSQLVKQYGLGTSVGEGRS